MTGTGAEKFEILKAMNTLIRALNNEEAYYGDWVYTIPDEVDDAELQEIAFEDEETFEEAVYSFKRCMMYYLSDGLYIGGKLY